MSASNQRIVTAGDAELIVRKSRFLGSAQPCTSAAEATAQLDAARRAHPKATHHVFAWRRCAPPTGALTYRFSDDGEPGGTAGRPVLQAIETQSLVGVQVIVVRYFGGIKLGSGGLVRAYGETAARAIAAAEIRPLIATRIVAVEVPFEQLSAVERWVSREGLTVLGRDFAAGAILRLEVPVARLEAMARELADLTGGTARTRPDEPTG